ncbi:MAG: alanine racemase [Candidatus Latescibacterota bacterium]|nr:alanine racemase [Candidatus Latescibacterota bacterium]
MGVMEGLETPAVLLDRAQLERNLVAMQELADAEGVALRPHAKTHKSVEIARRQVALGASGLTVATVGEARVFFSAGIGSITISRPMVSGLERLAPIAQRVDLRIVVDSSRGVEVAAASELKLGVFVKIDVGLHRCGVDPQRGEALALARQVVTAPNLDFRGVLSHAGQVYGVHGRQAAVEIAEAERTTMVTVRDELIAAGLAVPEVSVGATPTVLAAASFEGITEIRPGNYAFLDMLPIKVGVVNHDQISLSVLATIISKNDDFFITDAGSKTLTSDTGGHGMASAAGFGTAYPIEDYLDQSKAMVVAGLSEEHGKLTRGDYDLAVGAKVRIIPNHSCPVANLAREYAVLNGDKVAAWPIDAPSHGK